ncbi:MAG: dUTP diphosphatase [Chitinophagales bacterium]
MDSIRINLQRLPHHDGLPVPSYMTTGSSGVDIYSANQDPIVIAPGKAVLIPTGFALSIPPGFEAQIRPRSGLALKHNLTLLNTPGTIDSDYRGEIKVLVINLGDKEYIVKRGERIAQMVFARIERVVFSEENALDETRRGAGGFGHTG